MESVSEGRITKYMEEQAFPSVICVASASGSPASPAIRSSFGMVSRHMYRWVDLVALITFKLLKSFFIKHFSKISEQVLCIGIDIIVLTITILKLLFRNS